MRVPAAIPAFDRPSAGPLPSPGRIEVGGNVVEWWGGTTRTTFPDGLTLTAAPVAEGPGAEGQRKTAWECGYLTNEAGLDLMVREHEAVHTILAVNAGLAECPVLRAAAEGNPLPMSEAWTVERDALQIQRWLNDLGCRVDGVPSEFEGAVDARGNRTLLGEAFLRARDLLRPEGG